MSKVQSCIVFIHAKLWLPRFLPCIAGLDPRKEVFLVYILAIKPKQQARSAQVANPNWFADAHGKYLQKDN